MCLEDWEKIEEHFNETAVFLASQFFHCFSGVEVAHLEEPLILRMCPDILIASPVYLWTQMLTVTGREQQQ